ncbi:hypothetical protein JXA84_00375 [candidate division WOR-3 bacterium]|nr:hypothetical protein [candidate division WOR-3 bacterium]
MNKFLIFTVSLILAQNLVFAGEKYNLAKIDIAGPSDTEILASLGIDIVGLKPGLYAEAVLRDRDFASLGAMGFYPQIIIEDLENYYKSNMAGEGIFGDYLTYSEALTSMDSVSGAHPQIVSQRFILPNNTGDNTWDGNQVWAVKVSDNVSVQEDEPEVMICALHHAREPIGTSIAIYFLHWLSDNYGTDVEATWIVDNRQVWIVPIVNPDGYIYNEVTSGYGGMWRKNRRNSGGGNYGVDPNRNYSYMWGYDNNGSSNDPSSETYRGPSGASEPEVQSMINFYLGHEIRSCIDYHSYSQFYLYPWGYINQPTEDNWKFDSLTRMMASSNGYQCGRPGQLLYDVNGGSFDFGYGDTLKPKIFHVSPEVGTAFWQDDMIDGQISENHLANLITCWTAGLYLKTLNVGTSTEKEHNEAVQPGDTVSISLELFNYAAFDTGFAVSSCIYSDDPYVELIDPVSSYGEILPVQKKNNGSDELLVYVTPETPQGWIANMNAVITAQGDYLSESPFNFMVGTPPNGFFEDFESGSSNWTLQGIWQLRTNYSHSPSHSLGTGAYGNNQNISATMANGVDFPVSLSFWTLYDLEDGYDYGYVEISSTENPTWTNILTVNGEGHYTWEHKELSLSDYSSQHNVKIRFRLYSDVYITNNGWYIDDLVVMNSSFGDSVPSAPTPVSPANGGIVTGNTELTVANSTDPNGLSLTYSFKVYSDSLCVNVVREVFGVSQGSGGQTSWQVTPSLPVGTYYWRSYADNGHYRSLLSEKWMFGVSASVEETPLSVNGYNIYQVSNDKFHLDLPYDCSLNIKYFDVTGRIADENEINLSKGSHILQTSGLPAGVYFIRVIISSPDGSTEESFRMNVIN